MKKRIAISITFVVLAISALLLPARSSETVSLFPSFNFGLSRHASTPAVESRPLVNHSLAEDLEHHGPPGLLFASIFIPIFLVFVKPRASKWWAVFSVVMFLILASVAALCIAVLADPIFESNVTLLLGFYISAALMIFSPGYTLWITWRSFLLARRNRPNDAFLREFVA